MVLLIFVFIVSVLLFKSLQMLVFQFLSWELANAFDLITFIFWIYFFVCNVLSIWCPIAFFSSHKQKCSTGFLALTCRFFWQKHFLHLSSSKNYQRVSSETVHTSISVQSAHPNIWTFSSPRMRLNRSSNLRQPNTSRWYLPKLQTVYIELIVIVYE